MEHINIIITGIIALLTAISGWYFGYKRNINELKKDSLKTIDEQIKIYEIIIENLRDEIKMLIQKIDEQQDTIIQLEKSVKELKDELSRLR